MIKQKLRMDQNINNLTKASNSTWRMNSATHYEKNGISSFSKQPLTLAYYMESSQGEILSALRSNKIKVEYKLKNDIQKTFKKLEENLKIINPIAQTSVANNYLDDKRLFDHTNNDFSQLKQEVNLSSRMVTIGLDKITFNLNASFGEKMIKSEDLLCMCLGETPECVELSVKYVYSCHKRTEQSDTAP